MPNFDGTPYTQLTSPARGDVQGVIKDISEASPENQTKFSELQDLAKYGAWASRVLAVTASGAVTLLDTDPMFVEIDPDGVDRSVIFPAKGDNNHGYYIHHVGGANTLQLLQSDEVTEIAVLNAGEVRYVKPSATHDFVALAGGGGGGLTNAAASVTTSNVTGVAGTRHILDVSGMTASRDFNLPTPSAAGEQIAIYISAGDDTYELIVKRNSIEVTRLFITGETLEFVSTGTGAGDWLLIKDGRIPCLTLLRRTSSNANTTHAAATHIHATWNSASINRGDCANMTAVCIKVRRAGYYKVSGAFAPAASMADQHYAISTIWKNATVVSGAIATTDGTRLASAGARQSSTAGSSLFGGAFIAEKVVLLNAGDTVWYTFATEATDRGLLQSDNNAALTTELTYFSVTEVLPG